MHKPIAISLYDYTESFKPWAKAGYTCYAFDIQHGKINGGKSKAFLRGGLSALRMLIYIALM